MASDYYRLLAEALNNANAVQNPTVRPNRVLLTFQGAQEIVTLNEQLTAVVTALNHPAQWGVTTTGPFGGNWLWNFGQWS